MTDRPLPHSDKNPAPALAEDLDPEATQLLMHFRALSPKNQSLAVRLLKELQKTQGLVT